MSKKQKINPTTQVETLVKMFRLAAKLRNQMIAEGFTDNGGAIHSAERILDIMGMRLNYPDISLVSKVMKSEHVVFSIEARRLYNNGEKIYVEHIAPKRSLTRLAISKLEKLNDPQFIEFVRKNYQLALLSPAETQRLNKLNRTEIVVNRLEQAGIKLEKRQKKEK